jgi:hypothetical protein
MVWWELALLGGRKRRKGMEREVLEDGEYGLLMRMGDEG